MSKKKKLTPKAQEVLDALLEKSKCPHCKVQLSESNLSWTEEGEQTYRLTLAGGKIKNVLDYANDEFYNKGEGNFYCRDCGHDLVLSEEKAIKILKHHAS